MEIYILSMLLGLLIPLIFIIILVAGVLFVINRLRGEQHKPLQPVNYLLGSLALTMSVTGLVALYELISLQEWSQNNTLYVLIVAAMGFMATGILVRGLNGKVFMTMSVTVLVTIFPLIGESLKGLAIFGVLLAAFLSLVAFIILKHKGISLPKIVRGKS